MCIYIYIYIYIFKNKAFFLFSLQSSLAVISFASVVTITTDLKIYDMLVIN